MLQGSEIILVLNACYISKIRLEQLKVRVYENMVGIVTVNYANHGGKSSAYSPIVRNINKHELNSEWNRTRPTKNKRWGNSYIS